MPSIVSTVASVPLAFLNLWKRFWRIIYKALGFTKGSAFTLFAIFGGNLLFQPLLSFKLIGDNTSAGGIFYFSTGYNNIANKIHLIGLLFGSFLGFHQFIPTIRQKTPVVDQTIGYVATLLYLISQGGLLVNLPKAGGGDVSAMVALGLITVASSSSFIIAYINAFRGKTQMFKEWRLRAWGWAGTVFTLRFIILGLSLLMNAVPNGPWYTVQSCSLIYNTYTVLGLSGEKNPTATLYPACTGADSTTLTAVPASHKTPEGMATVYNYGFALAAFLSLILHSAIMELYFRKTIVREEPARSVSAESTLESGVTEQKKTATATVTEIAM